MDYFQAIILAIVQGITEFLPISSSAHLILVPKILGWQDQGLAFDVAVHVGTLFAVLAFLRREILQILPAWFSGFRGFHWNEHGRLGWWVILATIPVGLIGILGKDFIEMNLREPYVIALTTLIFGLSLAYADRHGNSNQKELLTMSFVHAFVVVGFAQALALIPGTSRSGITMTAALLAGYSRVAAARFSFLLAVPAIALPGLLEAKKLIESSQAVAWDILFLGIVVSALVAFLCMRLFMNFVERIGMMPFVYYRVLLAILIVWVFYV
ncbi:MAG: undecaprenyl-diphosphate phosphatase [Arenicella sp.]